MKDCFVVFTFTTSFLRCSIHCRVEVAVRLCYMTTYFPFIWYEFLFVVFFLAFLLSRYIETPVRVLPASF